MSTSTGKKYGLIISSKKKPSGVGSAARPSVFGDSSDEEDSGGRRHVNLSLRRENEKRSKQSHETVTKALQEDPTIFDYDGHYDNMVEQRKKADPRLKKKDTKPKYIHSLKRMAEKRKIEQEIIYERKVQREVEEEKEEFGDKETFVTSAYRGKLEERRVLEEELRREAAVEAKNSVANEKDLSKFYRHLLHQQTTSPATDTPTHATTQEAVQEEEKEGEREKGRPPSEKHELTTESETGKDEAEEDEVSKRLSGDGSPDRDKEEAVESPAKNSLPEATPEDAEPEENLEERRKRAAAKRTNEETFMSAKERYLSRKRAKLSVSSGADTS